MRRTLTALLSLVLLMPAVARAQESLAGTGAAIGMATGMGAIAISNINPQKLASKALTPSMPRDADRGNGNSAATGSMSVAPGAAVQVGSPVGQRYIGELLSHANAKVVTIKASTRRRHGHTVSAPHYAPVRNWPAYYLPVDRYKVTSGVWNYVSIEDDGGYYPVRYYYSPSSPQMLWLLSHHPKGEQARANRVIGFRTWRDAMLAGYRPDPISKPEPALGIIFMAQAANTPELQQYVAWVYNGQVAPDSFASSLIYARHVAAIVNSRADTRTQLATTMGQVYGAFVGSGSLPTSVGTEPEVKFQSSAGGSSNGVSTGQIPALQAGNTDKREDDFNSFSNKAGKLANVPANSH